MLGATPQSGSIFDTKTRQTPKKEEGNLLYYILMAFIVLLSIGGIILVGGGGGLNLTLSILILLVIGFNVFYWTIENTEYPDIWERDEEYNEEVNLKLRDTSDLVRRSFKGMEVSQAYLEKKIKNLFLDKLRNNRNLSREEMRELLEDPGEFRKVVDDEVISDFILSNKEEDELSSKERLEGDDYQRWISQLLKRIQGWE